MTVYVTNVVIAGFVARDFGGMYCVGLFDLKRELELQAPHQNEIQNVFLRRFLLNRFLAKTLRLNKNFHEKFLKKSVVRSRLETVGPASYV